jgi:TniQ
MIRSLPIRLEPRAGESLTSWLCACARRNQVSWHQILVAVGLYRRRRDTQRLSWAARLHAYEISALATATGQAAQTLHDMTLARFDGVGITTERRSPCKNLGALRGYANPWRYCPHCLADSGGRWQLHWMLGWSFACVTHRCLLADVCPRCQCRPQRRAPLGFVVPDLSTCGQLHRHSDRAQLCGTRLARARDDVAEASPEQIHAQRAINAAVEQRAADFAIYREHPASIRAVMADVRAIGEQAIESGFHRRASTLSTLTKSSAWMHISAWPTATALTAAVQILDSSDIARAAEIWNSATQTAGATLHMRSTAVALGYLGTTCTLSAVRLRAMQEQLSPADQLRYRVYTPYPCIPKRAETVLAKISRALPTQLWPEWALRLQPAGGLDDDIRCALACAVALVGTHASVEIVGKLLGAPGGATQLWKMLKTLQSGDRWPDIARSVTRLADHVATQPLAIDYHRRRQLNYDGLVTAPQWRGHRRCLGETEDAAFDVDIARSVLYERLSGRPARCAPWYRDQLPFSSACRRLSEDADIDRQHELNSFAAKYLAEQGIDEPISAVPPLSLIADLT